MLLASRRIIGDDGEYVSAREAAAKFGVDLQLLQRIQRAMGLPRVEDADAAVYLRADAEAAKFTRDFIEAGIDPEQLVQITFLLGDGLSRAAEAMRNAALVAVIRPGATEMEIAKESESFVAGIAPLLGPMIQNVLLLQLRHAIETEAVNASERAEGQLLPGARLVTIAFADLVGFTRLGEAVPPEDLEQLSQRLADLTRDVTAAPVRFIKTIGDEVMLVSPEPVPILDTVMQLIDATESDERFSAAARRGGHGNGGEPVGGLVRQPGESGLPGDGCRQAGLGVWCLRRRGKRSATTKDSRGRSRGRDTSRASRQM